MKFNKILLAAAMTSVLAISATSCSDDYAELNQNPANVSKADPKGLMTQAILNFQPNDYLIWYYNNKYYSRWTQMGVPTNSYDSEFTTVAETGGQGSQYISTLKYRNEIRLYIQNTGDESQRGYEAAFTLASSTATSMALFLTPRLAAIRLTVSSHQSMIWLTNCMTLG